MLQKDAGFSTIEGLIAIALLGIGTLAAASGADLGIRAVTAGAAAARAARLAEAVAADIRGRHHSPEGCTADGGDTTTATGEGASWRVTPDSAGVAVLITVRFRSLLAQQAESLWSFVRCR
jgi:Tfp pilus assembly protein PilV